LANDYRTKFLVPTLLALMLGAAVRAAPPPVEAFGRKPAMINVDINPAGALLAWIEDDGKKGRIVIHDIASGKTLRAISTVAPTKLWSVKWANDETLLIEQSITHTVMGDKEYTDEWQRWIAVDVSGGDNRMLLMRDGNRELVTGLDLLRVRTAKPGKVYMSTWDWLETRYRQETGSRLSGRRKDSGWVHNAYEVDLKSGNGRMIAGGTQFTTQWLVDDAGNLIVRSEYNPTKDEYEILFKDGGSWRRLYLATDCETLRLVSFTKDKSALTAIGRACGDDRSKVWSIPLDGAPMKALFNDSALEADGVHTDPFDGSLLGVALGGPDQPSRWLEPQAEKRNQALHKSFGARWVDIVARSADNTRVLARVEDSAHPPIYYLVDYAAKKADILNEAYPLLVGVELGAVRAFNYQARDKYALMAYLTIPPAAVEKNLPLVVMPHGGPESRDEPGFDWLAQFLASRGYAVLQPQFRGSTGFGQAHADAGRRQWGLRMQDDVTDGVRALIEQGIADPRRVCIVGWSYGGYSALAGATFTPELYACAASIGGISDLPDMVGFDFRNGGRESNSFAYVREHIGTKTDPQVIARSPARFAGAVRAPILLIHGVDDTVVPISQSQRMARALKAAGKPYELIELPGEDHWMMTSSASRIRTLTELEGFLWKHIGAPPAATN
jgi:dipeptidyl aminopeptidase/acylaminoacyl peptidase